MATVSYLFIFGRTPDLAFLELQTFFPKAERVSSDVARVETDEHSDIGHLMDGLGGTTKIALFHTKSDEINAGSLLEFLKKDESTLEFGASYYGPGHMPKTLVAELKKALEAQGIRSRYITPQHGDALSTVVVDKRGLQELIIVETPDGYLIGSTIATQRYGEWNERDYGRPNADPKAGMLPPKVARMIVNIAGKGGKILDPFCGMGTILAEAYMMGWTAFGSDSSTDAVSKAEKNMSWLIDRYKDTNGHVQKLFVSDAVHVSDILPNGTVDAIVTEPFMGSTRIANTVIVDIGKVKNILKGLEKLYIGCLKDWYKILVPGGRVVMALPQYDISGKSYSVKKVVDMCENLGYTIVVGPIAYGRPQAVVARQFYLFQKK